MDRFIDWVSAHTLTSVIILGTAYAIWFVFSHRKSLFYKQ
jgi:hypothetical protein